MVSPLPSVGHHFNSVALETMHNPEIILLEHPFAGLDAGDIQIVVQVLSKFAEERQCAIIVTIEDYLVEATLEHCQSIYVLCWSTQIYFGTLNGN